MEDQLLISIPMHPSSCDPIYHINYSGPCKCTGLGILYRGEHCHHNFCYQATIVIKWDHYYNIIMFAQITARLRGSHAYNELNKNNSYDHFKFHLCAIGLMIILLQFIQDFPLAT